MDELKLSGKEWHLLTIAYHKLVKEEAGADYLNEETQNNRVELGERIKEFTVMHVYNSGRTIVVRMGEKEEQQ